MNKEIEVIDLFCGAGGLSYGLRKAGLSVKAGIDLDVNCQYPYESNGNGKFIHADISCLNKNDIESIYSSDNVKVLVGCAPCQPFSSCATKVKDRKNDYRWNLLSEFARLISEIQPDIVCMENVPTLLNKAPFENFFNYLESDSYYVNYSVESSDDYGVPQSRKRLTLLASKFGNILLKNPKLNPKKTVQDAIGHLPPIKAGTADKTDPIHRCSALSDLNLRRIKSSKQGGTWRDWDKELLPNCYRKPSGRGFCSVYGRLEWDKPAVTLTTNFTMYGTGRYGHPEQNRALSLREGALLQSFPENYRFSPPNEEVSIGKVARYIGNAVPPKLGEWIGKSIMEHIYEYQR